MEGGKGRGKFMVILTVKGNLTAWASKALQRQAGAAVVKKDGSAVGNALSSKVRMWGLMRGSGEKNGKQMGAAAASGERL